MTNQEFSSKDTSINTVNKVYTKYTFYDGSNVLDYGGGRYDANTEFMKSKNVFVDVYDPFNRTEQHNKKVIDKYKNQKPDYVVCSNVLNVIKESEIVEDVVRKIANYKTTSLFVVYEGDKSGKGKVTSKGYQRNQRKEDYFKLLSKYFEIVNLKNGIYECMNK